MKTFTFRGWLHYRPSATAEKISTLTRITIEATSLRVARAIVRNYGMDSIHYEPEEKTA